MVGNVREQEGIDMPKISNVVLAAKIGELAALCKESGCPAETAQCMIKKKYPDVNVIQIQTVVDEIYSKPNMLVVKL